MEKEIFLQKVNSYLQNEHIDYNLAAADLGKQALNPLKKIIALNDNRAARAIELQKEITLLQSKKKSRTFRVGHFSFGMRSILSISPDDHIKGFGGDMIPRRKGL